MLLVTATPTSPLFGVGTPIATYSHACTLGMTAQTSHLRHPTSICAYLAQLYEANPRGGHVDDKINV